MNWWQYLLLVNIYLVLFYGFYALLLRKETFFQLNRVYLVSAAALSFFIPMMQADWVQNLFITQEIKYTVYGSPVMLLQMAPIKEAPINIGQILAVVYIAGVAVLFAKLVWQLFILNRMIKKDQHDTAYSFFSKINLPDEVKDNKIVALHEQVHARQLHTIDVFIIEAVMIINWFNPIVYFYRRAIKHIHEFIADDHATKEAANKADYAMLLLTQTFQVPSHNLVNSFFNHSLLKQRIIMLQKNKSQRVKLLKYGLSAPLFMLMLILTSATVNNSKAVKAINDKVSQVLLLPPSTVISTPHKELKNTPSPEAIIATQEASKQDNDIVSLPIDTNKSQIFAAVEKEPEFPGGQENFMKFIAANIKYPQDMIANNISGKAIITFVIETNGSLSNIKSLKAPTQSAGDEAVRVIGLSPKWSPGIQNGHKVRVQFTVPVNFNTTTKATGYNAVSDTDKKPVNVVLVPSGKIDPLYIIDGKEMKSADVKNVNANDIKSVYVLKDNNAVAQYGEKGKHGVIVIYTKAYTGPIPAAGATGK